VRDGRTQLLHSPGDLACWLDSFARGECVRPAAGVCSRCDRLHVDRDVDGELLANCLPCAGELVVVGAEMLLHESTRGDY
jgi:hypothetical protein